MALDAGVASEPISRVMRALPWDLADLIAYLLLGMATGFVGLATFYGVDRVAVTVEQHTFVAVAVGVILGYPVGILTSAVGKLFREFVVRLFPTRTAGRGTDYMKGLAPIIDAVIGGRLRPQGAPEVPLMHELRVGVLLAEKHLPGAAANINRQSSMFKFFVTLIGGSLLTTLFLEIAALLRWQDVLPGSAAPYAFGGLASLAIMCLAENRARNSNFVVAEAMADTAAAVSILLAAEKPK
jgi:hypothetical protein